MRARAGSFIWLLIWDIRLRLRATRLFRWRSAALPWQLFTLLLLHAFSAVGVVYAVRQERSPAESLQLIQQFLAMMAPALVMYALLATLRMLLAGNEFSLLLQSPLPFAKVYAVRVLGCAAGTWGVGLFFLAPIANVGALIGHPLFLLIYPVSLALATLAAGAALLLMTGCVHLGGVHAARRWLRRLQALVPLLLVTLALITAATPGSWAAPLAQLFRFPAQALLGDARSLLLLAATAVAVLGIAGWLSEEAAERSLREPEESSPGTRSSLAAPVRFGRSLFWLLAQKEWKTILRDLRLSSALLIQPLLAAALLVVRLLEGRLVAAGVAAGATFSAAFIGQQLSQLAISAEEAPSLLACSPQSRLRLIRYKCAAMLLPLWILLLPAALWLARKDPWLGMVTYACVLAASFSAALVEVLRPYPVARRSFLQPGAARRRREPLDAVSILLLQMLWGYGAWLAAIRSPLSVAVLGGAMLIPLLVWMRDTDGLARAEL